MLESAPSPSSEPPTPAKRFGRTEPRLFTEPLRELTRATSHGFAVADFAELVLGEPLLPWQRWLAIHAMELTPDGLYRFRTIVSLVARQSGKTSFVKTLALWRLYIDGAALVMGAAQSRDTAKEAWRRACQAAESSPELRRELKGEPRKTNGDEELALLGGGRYRISATTEGAGRGFSVDMLVMDEVRQQRDWKAWSALSKTVMARPRGQIWCISNAGDDQSVVLNALRESAIAGRDPSVALFEWSAPDGCDLADPAMWEMANPGMGYTVSEQAIRSALATDPPNVFRTEILCQRVRSLDGAVDENAWADAADPAGSILEIDAPLVACIDASPDGNHASLVAACVVPGSGGRVRVETVAAWNSLEEARVGLADIVGKRVDVGTVNERARFAALAWFPAGPAAGIGYEIQQAAQYTEGVPGRFGQAVELTGVAVLALCQAFAVMVAANQISHGDDPLLNAHVAGAKRQNVGDGWRFARKDMGHCDALYAAAGAAYLARQLDQGDASAAAAFL